MRMMINLNNDILNLTNRQKMILDLYMKKVSGRQIALKMKISKSIVYRDILFLINNGYTDKTPIIRPVVDKMPVIELVDKFAESMTSFNFTEEQKEFINKNKKMSRRELAKILKINKAFLNHALQKNCIFIEKKLELT
jgi:predicted transcriptional regulator